MKIVGISDLHGFLPNDLPEGDVLCICGDIVPLEYQNNMIKSSSWFLLKFVPWSNALKYKHIIFIGGNHDFLFYKISNSLENSLDKPHKILDWLIPDNIINHKLIYLQDNEVVIDNVKFYGMPHVVNLFGWAFNCDNEHFKLYCEKIPKDTDVILTHCPPTNNDLGTVLSRSSSNYGNVYGSIILDKVLENRNFKLLLCGHVHSGNHNLIKINDKYFANVSIKNENYELNNKEYFSFNL